MSRWRRPTPEQLAAFEAFVAHHTPELRRLSHALATSSSDAQDLLQETLALVLERWEKVAAAQEPYFYARRIMANASISLWRRHRREIHSRSSESELMTAQWSTADSALTTSLWGDRPAAEVNGVDAALLMETRSQLLASLRTLPSRQRTVVALRYLEGLPDVEVAEIMGISAVTVRSTAHRALRSLRANMPPN